MKLWLILIVALIIGGIIIVVSSNYSLTDKEDRKAFLDDFGKWLGQLFKNTKNLAGYAVSEDWMPPHK